MIVILTGIGLGVIGYYLGSFLTVISSYLFRLSSGFLFNTSMDSFPILFRLVDSGLIEMIFGGGIAGYVTQSKKFELSEKFYSWVAGFLCALVVIALNLMILRSPEATPRGPAPIDAMTITGLVFNLPTGALGGLLGAALCRARLRRRPEKGSDTVSSGT